MTSLGNECFRLQKAVSIVAASPKTFTCCLLDELSGGEYQSRLRSQYEAMYEFPNCQPLYGAWIHVALSTPTRPPRYYQEDDEDLLETLAQHFRPYLLGAFLADKLGQLADQPES